MTLAYTFMANDFLRFFTEDRRRGWEETATSWLITAVVISVLCAGGMLLYKFFQRRAAGNIKEQTWSRGETVLLMLFGLIPVLFLVSLVWYSYPNYYNVMRLPGLFKGIAFAWVLYLLFMVVGHLAGPWRRDLV
jgi:heme/copper-type cytochrome/quinol oxidase subunit 2